MGEVKRAQEAQVMSLVNKILLQGLQEGVTEIHIEPQEECFNVRFRKDGVLYQACDPIGKQVASAMVSYLKTMAELDTSQISQPQESRIEKIFQGKKINFRFSTLPCRYGEKVVLLLWHKSTSSESLEKLIFHKKTLKMVQEIINFSSGLLLVTGPPKSGKSTTLYSLLIKKNEYGSNICTLEDQIECIIPRINQVKVQRDQGMDYDFLIKCLIGQNVDVLLVDRIEKKETAQMVVEAAMTDCLVMSSLLNKSDGVRAITLLEKMEIDPLILAEILVGVINQRLIKRICRSCRIPYHLSQDELAKLGKYVRNEEEVTFYKAKTLTMAQIEQAKAKGTLCPYCKGRGYKGKIGVYEVLVVTKRIKDLIGQNADSETILSVAEEEGMISLFSYAWELAYLGLTSLEEIERVFPLEIKAKKNAIASGASHKRIEKLEKLLFHLTNEVEQLKQELNQEKIQSSVAPDEELSYFEHWQPQKQKLDSNPPEPEYEKLTLSDGVTLPREKKQKIKPLKDEVIADPW
ncbi:MAG: type II/IV secretion system protein [Gomphosphaeria aponina SAG 52.96 = DSM 107014]|uniref:Type II/IV secretion system protein n=1 Tax=Gomphosphaeria aponina SAG 52.96 = DSM 107014 TaxID=1521640 RepID=A0A941GWI2_9CHRO|nr:type II/IV secretion system protein [Gomphosphaeria aponina SAG 52.96 = DSM 107014]